MERKSMTALISAYARAYHSKNASAKIFDDDRAELLLTKEEYGQISQHMSGGIKFFNPDFVGSQEEALKWVVDHYLSPTPLGRAAYAESLLEVSVKVGACQYIILAAGYDTFAFRQPEWAKVIPIFELDHAETASDKLNRLRGADIEIPTNVHFVEADFTVPSWNEKLLENTFFSKEKISFFSMLGLSYYLTEADFKNMLMQISQISPKGSTLVFDYPDEDSFTARAGERTKKQIMMASQAGEAMRASYAYSDMEKLLSDCGFLIYEHLTPKSITNQYFEAYNRENPLSPMSAFDNVNYCLAVKA